MTTTSTVSNTTDAREAERPLGMLAANAALILFWGQHVLPTPISLEFRTEFISLGFASREALDAWHAALAPADGYDVYARPVSSQPYTHNGANETLHNAYSTRWGYRINLTALTPAVPDADPLAAETTEALAALTAVEDDAAKRIAPHVGEPLLPAWASRDGWTDPNAEVAP